MTKPLMIPLLAQADLIWPVIPFKGTVAWDALLAQTVPFCLDCKYLEVFFLILPISNQGKA